MVLALSYDGYVRVSTMWSIGRQIYEDVKNYRTWNRSYRTNWRRLGTRL